MRKHSQRTEAVARVREHTVCARPALCPELSLHLATPATRLWRASEAEAEELGFHEPYWAFCWPGGQALARWVLDNAGDLTGQRVLDFGCGGAIAGIAAALRGARVIACDIDPLAAVAASLNAALNGVQLEVATDSYIDRYEAWDMVLVGDVTYDATLTESVTRWLQQLVQNNVRVLIGDPGRGYLATAPLRALQRYMAPSDCDGSGEHRIATTVYEFLAME